MSNLRLVEYLVTAVLSCIAFVMFWRLKVSLARIIAVVCISIAAWATTAMIQLSNKLGLIEIDPVVQEILWTTSSSFAMIAAIMLCAWLTLYRNGNGR